MPLYTIASLSANRSVNFRFSGHPELLNQKTNRAIKRYAGGGRLYLFQSGILSVTLEAGSQYFDFAVAISPASDLSYEEWCYSGAEKLIFQGQSVQVYARDKHSLNDVSHQQVAQQEQNVQRLDTQLQEMNERAAALQEQIAQVQSRIDKLAAKRAELMQSIGRMNALTQELEAANLELDKKLVEEHSLQEKVEDLRTQNDASSRRCISLKAEINEWDRQIAESVQRLKKLQTQKQQKEEEYETCSPAVLDALRQEINQLSERNRDAEQEYLELDAKKNVQKDVLEKQRKMIEDVRQQIEAQPEALRTLQADYENLSQRLEQIQRAETDCSEEKQQAIRDQIAQREPIAHELTQQYTALQEQHTAVENSVAQLQADNTEIINTLWPKLLNVLEALRGNVDDKNAQLDELWEEAQRFTQQVNRCTQKQSALVQWYQADKTPLQSLLERIDLLQENENGQLLQTMTLEKTGRIRQLFVETEGNLEELDAILRDAAKAVQRDEKYLRLRVETNEAVASAEMKKA